MMGTVLLLVAALLADGQLSGRRSTSSAANPPTGQITGPTAEATYETSVQLQVISGVAADDVAVTAVTASCTGATTATPTVTGTTSWSFSLTFNVGETVCVVTISDGTLTVQDTLTVTVVFPDAQAPVVAGGADDSTANASYSRTVTCTDDLECVRVTWQRTGVSATDCTMNGTGTSRTADCVFTLTNTGVATVNTITLTAYDQSNNTDTDTVLITMTVALRLTTPGFNACTLNVPCTLYLDATGGDGTYTFAKTTGTYLTSAAPTEFALANSGNRGVITGTCTTSEETVTGHVYTVTDGAAATDANDDAGESTFSMHCNNPAVSTYFDDIAGRTDSLAITGCTAAKGCELETMAELTALAQSGVAEDYSIDAALNNAAKITWPQANESLTGGTGGGLRFPILRNTGAVLTIWDFRFGVTWTSTACAGGMVPPSISGYKHKEFQNGMSPGADDYGAITAEIRTNWPGADCTKVGVIDLRTYLDEPQTDAQLSINNKNNFSAGADNSAGQGTPGYGTIPLYHSVWTRYWSLMELNLPSTHAAFQAWRDKYLGGAALPAGDYHAWSLWIADENHDVQRVGFRIPLRISPKEISVSTLTCASQVVTVTTPAADPHTLGVGEALYIAGASETDFNGLFTAATVVSTTQFTYALSVACPASSGTGTMTMGPARTKLNYLWHEHNTSANHSKAQGNITVTNNSASVVNVPKSAQFTRVVDGETLAYKPIAAVDIPASSSAAVLVQAIDTSDGPRGNADEGTILTVPSSLTALNIASTAPVATGGLTGGAYLLNGDLIAHTRWFNALAASSASSILTLTGVSSAEDLANNAALFARPVP